MQSGLNLKIALVIIAFRVPRICLRPLQSLSVGRVLGMMSRIDQYVAKMILDMSQQGHCLFTDRRVHAS